MAAKKTKATKSTKTMTKAADLLSGSKAVMAKYGAPKPKAVAKSKPVKVEVPMVLPPAAQAVSGTAMQMAAEVKALALTGATLPRAQTMLVQLKSYTTKLESTRKALTKPLKDHAKRIESMFKPTLDALARADQELRQKVLAFQNEAQAAIEAEKRKLTSEAIQHAEAGDHETALALASQVTTLEAASVKGTTDNGSVSTTTVTTFEVVDYGLVPDEFFSLDSKKVLAAIRAGRTEIPGILVKTETALRVAAIDAEAARADSEMADAVANAQLSSVVETEFTPIAE